MSDCHVYCAGTILSVCMCCPGNQETLEEWMDMMLADYPNLTQARVVYSIKETNTVNKVNRLASTRTELLEDR